MRTFPAPNTSTFLQTTFAADAHLAEGKFLLERCKVSDIPSTNTETNNFQNGSAEFNITVDFSKKKILSVN
jgi:hypothetical protein